MRQVRTCDFCDDDATGIYEPLPATIPDAPRLLLCDDCRDTLASVVEPLLALVEDGIAPGSDASSPGTRDAPTDASTAGGSGTAWPNADRDAGTAASASEGATGPDGSGATAAASPTEPADTTAGEDDSGPTDDDASAPSEEPATNPPSGPAVGESRDASGRTQQDRARTPRGYRKVMRFLENRAFPIDRADAERLASEAYAMDDAEVAAAIDHAVQYGRLREVSGELKR